jgi:hypothetical protein
MVTLAALLAVVPLAGITPGTPGSAAAATGRTETPVRPDPKTPGVTASLVTISAPLPASSGPHPAACDSLSYLRYRSRSGPASAASADRILVAQPGALAGASSMDQLARHTIIDAAAHGQHLEFWALDRRANCLEDNTGLTAAVAAGSPSIALNYYTKGAAVNGRTFAGYVPERSLGWLTRMGMQQTVKDEYTLLTAELPDPALRAAKVWCGGHSLGGVVTGLFAMSDFDGDPATLGDAGYRQCAGYFALDTRVSTTIIGELPAPSNLPGLVALGRGAVEAAWSSGLLPKSLNIPVVNPETINLLALAGIYAKTAPTGLSPLPSSFKDNAAVSFALRFLLSKDLGAFVSGIPDVTAARITNQAALGALTDDNSTPIALLQASTGFFTGGKLVDKTFPTGNDLLAVPALRGVLPLLTGIERRAIPDDVGPVWAPGTGPVYRWLNYNQVARDGSGIPRSRVDGKPFTTGASEVTDINDLATALSAYPLDFTEHYFPVAMLSDALLWAAGDRSVVPTAIHAQGPTAHPVVNLWGADGVMTPLFAGQPLPPNTLVLKGYQHLDPLTAAATQNDGTPEQGAAYLSSFVRSH